jgi:hypothetical protein
MIEIVISKYNENIDWSNKLKSKVIIYDKSNSNNNYIKLPNIGREAHTYLYYIINNYNNLPEYVCFLQGNPFDHLNIENINQIENESFLNKDFIPLNKIYTCELNGNPHHPNLNFDFIFDDLFIEKPININFIVGAQFIVKKENILNRSLSFYKELYKYFERNDINDLIMGVNKMPWVMERIWLYIFDKSLKTKL